MSFISIEHFAQPFRNKVHLIAICIIAALFGIFRLQGGAVAIEDINAHQTSLQHKRSLIPSRKAPAQATEKRNIYQKRTAPARQAPQNDQSGLDEIERTLGLR